MAPLSGHYQPEHLFALEQAVMRYDFYQQRVHDCDMQIEALIKTLNSDCCVPTVPLPKPRHKTRQPNQLNFDVRKELYQLVGTDGGHRFDSDLWHWSLSGASSCIRSQYRLKEMVKCKTFYVVTYTLIWEQNKRW